MASYNPLKKNTAQRIVFPILDADGDPVTGATTPDTEYSLDGASFADIADEAHEIATASGIYYVDLAQGETNGDVVAIQCKTATSGAKTTVLVFYTTSTTLDLMQTELNKVGTIVNTGGTATIGGVLGDFANSAAVTRFGNLQTEANKMGTIVNTGGTATIGGVLGDVANSAVATRLTNAQTELNKIGTVTNTGGTATIGAVLGDFANTALVTRLNTIDDFIDTEAAAILADTNELQTDWVNGGRLDLLIDAIKAITDLLTLASIADAVHDEVTEGTTTLRQAVKLISSALFAKTSGGGTATLIARDIADTKPRITLTADADGNRTAVVLDGA
jgi:hypothetical protein